MSPCQDHMVLTDKKLIKHLKLGSRKKSLRDNGSEFIGLHIFFSRQVKVRAEGE